MRHYDPHKFAELSYNYDLTGATDEKLLPPPGPAWPTERVQQTLARAFFLDYDRINPATGFRPGPSLKHLQRIPLESLLAHYHQIRDLWETATARREERRTNINRLNSKLSEPEIQFRFVEDAQFAEVEQLIRQLTKAYVKQRLKPASLRETELQARTV